MAEDDIPVVMKGFSEADVAALRTRIAGRKISIFQTYHERWTLGDEAKDVNREIKHIESWDRDIFHKHDLREAAAEFLKIVKEEEKFMQHDEDILKFVMSLKYEQACMLQLLQGKLIDADGKKVIPPKMDFVQKAAVKKMSERIKSDLNFLESMANVCVRKLP